MAAALTAMLLSLAGLPLTAGFVGKFVIITAGAGAELWVLAVILAVNGTISIFYYLKIISAMFRGFTEPGKSQVSAPLTRIPFLAACAVAVLVVAVVALGVYPSPLLSFLGTFTSSGF
jgi:NADH-quinone oxidoreductase subunit N